MIYRRVYHTQSIIFDTVNDRVKNGNLALFYNGHNISFVSQYSDLAAGDPNRQYRLKQTHYFICCIKRGTVQSLTLPYILQCIPKYQITLSGNVIIWFFKIHFILYFPCAYRCTMNCQLRCELHRWEDKQFHNTIVFKSTSS